MHLPVKLLATALSALAFTAAATLATPAIAGASGPIATQAKAHPRRAHRACGARVPRRRAVRACKSSRARTRQKLHTVRPRRVKQPASSTTSVLASKQSAIAAALSVSCVNTELVPAEGNTTLVRAAVLCLVNRERAQNGVSPLLENQQLDAAAEDHSRELIADDYFAHIAPSGETPVDRIRATGYIPGPSDGYVIGENLAWGTYNLSTAQSIVSAWIASPGHLANILESKYTETGIGIVSAVPSSLANGAPGATYAQEFGVIVP
ncbi:MAG: CAP domain-containing protein [Solirubrobacteraceae bacterium]